MGGLISHYAVYAYPEVFGRAGIFSPSYWYAEEAVKYTATRPVPDDTRLYLIVGSKEGDDMVSDLGRMKETIAATGHPNDNLYTQVHPGQEHNEAYWRGELGPALRWLFTAER